MDKGNPHAAEASPGLSVVVATMNRSHLLPRMYAALAAQTHPDPWELVVVNDASTDETAAVLADLASRDDRVRVVNLPINGGPAQARNVGWRTAKGDLILFTDDDCVTSPAWIASMAQAFEDGADLVEGPIRADPDNVERVGVFGRTIDQIDDLNPFFATCNLGVRRSWLEKLEGFDENFPYPWCEDVDLGQRSAKEGARITFAPGAQVVHDVIPANWRGYVRDRRRRVSDALLIEKHPHMRAWLGDLDRHTPALSAAAGLLLMMASRHPLLRWVVGPLLTLRYVQQHARRERPPGVTSAQWWLAGPGVWAADTWEAARFTRKRTELAVGKWFSEDA